MRKFEGFEKGVNFGGWYSQCDNSEERYNNFITEKDFETVAAWGADHVRIPVDYNLVETKEGEYKENGFARIETAINYCKKNNLNMILDLHKTFGYSFDEGEKESGFFENEKYQERFYRLWEQFAERFGKYKDMLAFELLNEVTDESLSDIWNDISNKCIKRIRAIVPDIKILVGGYWNNSAMSVKDLAMPYDENIVYTFHSYDPTIFTHQGAYWIKEMPLDFRTEYPHTFNEYRKISNETLNKGDASFDYFSELENNILKYGEYDMDKPLDYEFFERLFMEAIQTAEERNVPLYCGEYGVIDRADTESTVKWYKEINKVFRKYNIGRCAWNFREKDFGLSDEHMKPVIDELVKYL